MNSYPIVPASFYTRPAFPVAHDLIGKLLISRRDGITAVGRIVTTCACCPVPLEDSRQGYVWVNEALPGQACVVPTGSGLALYVISKQITTNRVLIGAVEPVRDVEAMYARRPCTRSADVSNSPEALCQAFGIDADRSHLSLTQDGRLWIAEDPEGAEPTISVEPESLEACGARVLVFRDTRSLFTMA